MSNSNTPPERVRLIGDKGTRITVAASLAGKVRGFRPLGQAAAAPEGEPSEDWTVAQLRGWAEANGVDLDGASRKSDILDAIAYAGEGSEE